MINNERTAFGWGTGVATLFLVAACARAEAPRGYAGVVEYEERRLGFEFAGRLLERPVERGSRVEKEQILARLDARLESLTAAVRAEEMRAAEARTDLVSSEAKPEDLAVLDGRIGAARAVEERVLANVERERKLSERGVTPPALVEDLERELERARADLKALKAQRASLARGAKKQEIASARAQAETARAAFEVSEERVKRYELAAPLSGEIVEIHVEPGETVAAGAPIVTLADTTHPIVEVFVPEGRAVGLRIGAKATLRVDGDARAYPAEIEYLASRLEFSPRFLFSEEERPKLVLRVRLRVQDPEHRLVAGLPAFASFQ